MQQVTTCEHAVARRKQVRHAMLQMVRREWAMAARRLAGNEGTYYCTGSTVKPYWAKSRSKLKARRRAKRFITAKLVQSGKEKSLSVYYKRICLARSSSEARARRTTVLLSCMSWRNWAALPLPSTERMRAWSMSNTLGDEPVARLGLSLCLSLPLINMRCVLVRGCLTDSAFSRRVIPRVGLGRARSHLGRAPTTALL